MNELAKQNAAKAAIDMIPEGAIIGVGTGTTVNIFIDFLATIRPKIAGALASSEATQKRLEALQIPILDPNTVEELPLYFDSADCFTLSGELIKGGGGALTREKILASMATTFICMVDRSKLVHQLEPPVPLEVLLMARSVVARTLITSGATPNYRQHTLTDNGNCIIDVSGLNLDPVHHERWFNTLPGVLENGIFAKRKADWLLIGSERSVETIKIS